MIQGLMVPFRAAHLRAPVRPTPGPPALAAVFLMKNSCLKTGPESDRTEVTPLPIVSPEGETLFLSRPSFLVSLFFILMCFTSPAHRFAYWHFNSRLSGRKDCPTAYRAPGRACSLQPSRRLLRKCHANPIDERKTQEAH